MVDASTAERHARNIGVISDLRANAGTTGAGQVLVILHTIGAKSGRLYEMPVCVRVDGSDLIVAATVGGQSRHPQWYVNLRSSPEITVEYLGESLAMRPTTVINSVDRDRLFQMMGEEIPGIYSYQDRCRDERQIPIVRLERI